MGKITRNLLISLSLIGSGCTEKIVYEKNFIDELENNLDNYDRRFNNFAREVFKLEGLNSEYVNRYDRSFKVSDILILYKNGIGYETANSISKENYHLISGKEIVKILRKD